MSSCVCNIYIYIYIYIYVYNTILIYRSTYIFASTGLLRPDILVRPLRYVLVHCRLVHCRLVHCGLVHCGLVHCRLVHCRLVHCRLVHCRLVHCRLVHCGLELFFRISDLKGDVFSDVGRLKRVLFACSEKGVCRQYRPSPLCTSCIYRLLPSTAVLSQESSTLLYGLCCFLLVSKCVHLAMWLMICDYV